jgi:hypothetical protein
MNSIRTDLCYMYAHSAEFEQVCAEEFEPFGVDANAGARALWLAIEEALNDVKYEYAPENVGAWRDPKELLAGPQTYIFDDIEYYKLEPVEVRWKKCEWRTVRTVLMNTQLYYNYGIPAPPPPLCRISMLA